MTIERKDIWLFGLIKKTTELPVGTDIYLCKWVSHRMMSSSHIILRVLSPDEVKISDGTCSVLMPGFGDSRVYLKDNINNARITKRRTDVDILTTRHTLFTWKP